MPAYRGLLNATVRHDKTKEIKQVQRSVVFEADSYEHAQRLAEVQPKPHSLDPGWTITGYVYEVLPPSKQDTSDQEAES